MTAWSTVSVPQHRLRLAIAVWLALLAAVQTWLFWSQTTIRPSDLEPVWAGARGLLAGKNPYEIVGPGRELERELPLFYPFTTVLLSVPLAPFPLRIADAIFAGLGVFVFVYGVTHKTLKAPALAAFFSAGLWAAVQSPQWSPLLTGAALVPSLGFLLSAKPTIGAAFLLAYPSRRAILGLLAAGVVSLAIWPMWIPEWLQEVRAGGHIIAPVTRWGGPLILLALLKWRRSEARLLAALACIPHTPMLYESVPLFLVPKDWYEGVILAVLTIITHVVIENGAPYTGYADWMNASGQWIVYLLYLPCVAMILRRQNVQDPTD